MSNHMRLCNEDCNHCEAIRNRQVSLALYVLRGVFGENITGIVNEICPNLTCCADCHIDDFCHFRDDDGSVICEIEKTAGRLSRKWKRCISRATHEAKNKNKCPSPRRPRVRFPGIGEAAAALGVERSHLWRVLTGQRQSRSLLARYAEWKGGAR